MTKEIERPSGLADPPVDHAAPGESTLRKIAWGVTYCALVFLGWVAIFGPRNIAGGKRYFSGFEGLTAGDHVQTTYYLWLWWHALTTGSHSPWTDPFQFAATGHITRQPFGWPMVIVSIPAQALFGAVGAFNAMLYATFIAAAGATYLWVRSLDLPRYAAAIAGFSFAFAPFRLAQRGHINSYVSFLLPLALYGAERALNGREKGAKLAAWVAAASIVSLCASGEMHVVVFFAPVYALYLVVRGWKVPRPRLRSLIVPFVALAVGSLFFLGLTFKTVYAPSVRASDYAPDVPQHYAPRPMDLVRRSNPSERTAYPGMITFGLAAIGVVAGLKRRDRKVLIGALVVIIVGAYALAMVSAWGQGGLDFYNSLKIVHRIRDPGRIVLVASLAFACLAAYGASRIRLRGTTSAVFAAMMIGFLLWDVAGFTRNISAIPAEGNLSPTVPHGAAVLDLPPFSAGHFLSSRYTYQIIENPGPHVGGYSVFVTKAALDRLLSTHDLANDPPDPCRWFVVSKDVKFDYVTVHTQLFGNDQPNKWHETDGAKLVRDLDKMAGLKRVSSVRDVVTYKFDRNALACRR